MDLLILSQIRKFFKKYCEFLKTYREEEQYCHKIINENYLSDEKITIFTVKSLGMAVCPKFNANELACDDEILKNFHPVDIKRIMKAYFFDNRQYFINSVKYIIIAKTIRGDKNYFTLCSVEDKNYVKKMSSSELISNKEILYSLSKEDMSEVCYAAGEENVFFEVENIKCNQENKIINLKTERIRITR